MLWLYALGGAAWVLGFVALVPWLRALDAGATATSARRVLLSAYVMSVALTAAMFAWFGLAMGRYAQVDEAVGLGVLLLLAPIFQPQVLVFALVRHFARRRYGAVTGAWAGSAAWVATEWALPKLLGDTLGHGLYPSALLRQAGDLVGAAGLTLLLLWTHEAVLATWVAWARRAGGVRAVARPLALAVLVPLLLAGYGLTVPAERAGPANERLRLGLVQSNIVDYERLRRERGAGAVVREVLDTHYAMSYDAVERQKVQALLWSETVYPTTFGHPKSEAGAELDREILGIVDAAGVPLVFGTYDRDPDRDPDGSGGEYNAAAFVAPGTGLVGVYRKTRLFPFTEALPAWLGGPLEPLVRSGLPWAGAWRPGNGARVFPLRLADGREIPVLPLICLDDVDTGLAIDGARLGAMLILTMSNDSWFTEHPQGARLHLAVAAFRSIETRLPQFRVTSNGYSAVIDARGEVMAGTRMGERTLVVGELPVREPPRTLMVAWGDWVGRASAVFLLVLAAYAGGRAWRARAGAAGPAPASTAALPAQVAVLTPAVRFTAGALRALACGSLLWLAATVVAGEGALASNTLAQIRAFIALVLAPEAAARGLLWASRATLSLHAGLLVLARGTRRIELAVREVVGIRAWRLPIPGPGVSLTLASGSTWACALANVDATALQAALAAAHAPGPPGAPPTRLGKAAAAVPPASPAWAARYAQACLAPRGSRFLQHTLTKFVGLPFLLAIPAFRLHQHIAFGGGLGEWQLFGLAAYAKGFALWWAAWGIGVVMVAGALRSVIEAGTLAVVLWRPARALEVRQALERLGLAALYLGIPTWLALRFVGG
ncbi:MAG: apolipoprotein N-acyltransferase [Burkholderiales bacterium]|nr:apolipoprotein N-acyltransferase [Burkholderiales bacterium]